MKEYHKIQGLFKRDQKTHKFIEGDWTLPEFEYLKDNEWMWTEKVDGTNIRVMWQNNELEFRGRTDRAQMPPALAQALNDLFQPKTEFLTRIFENGDACLYGEGYGAGIQKGGKYRPNAGFVLFDIRIGDWWLKREDVEQISTDLGLDIVPIVSYNSITRMIEYVRAGIPSKWGDFVSEGVVGVPRVPMLQRSAQRIITKIKTVDFS